MRDLESKAKIRYPLCNNSISRSIDRSIVRTNALDFLFSFFLGNSSSTTIIELNFNREIVLSFMFTSRREREEDVIISLQLQELLPIEKFHDKSRRQIQVMHKLLLFTLQINIMMTR